MQTTHANSQYQLTPADLETLLALVRSGTLAQAGERLGVDASTVFRALQRMERGLGQTLFARSRSGYLPGELAQALASHAEQMEAQLQAARVRVQQAPDTVSGLVRITTTDSILQGLILPCLPSLRAAHPNLTLDITASHERVDLRQRDADIAVRATRQPPEHLVGRKLGILRLGLYAHQASGLTSFVDAQQPGVSWIVPDEALPDHPSVRWRKRHFPKAQVVYRVNSLVTICNMVQANLGVGVLPQFLGQQYPELTLLHSRLDEAESELWLLTHPESRHLHRVNAVFQHLAQHLQSGAPALSPA